MREGIKTYLADLLVMGGGGTFLKPVLGVIAPTHILGRFSQGVEKDKVTKQYISFMPFMW